MIDTSSFVLSLGLQYHNDSLDSDAQTVHPGMAGSVSRTLGNMALTGCFFHFL